MTVCGAVIQRSGSLRCYVRQLMTPALQDLYAPQNKCFGCGPANPKGLRIKSFLNGDVFVTTFMPETHHEAWEGVVNGGIVGCLFDCHSNWAAAYHLMTRAGTNDLPPTVTADFHVKLRKPTPSKGPVIVKAKVVESTDDRATVEATIEVDGVITSTCRGTFVAVKPGHPAYHRW